VSSIASLELEHEDGTLHARIRGELDLATCDDLRRRLQPALLDAGSAVLDLSAVSFIDSAGLRMLVQLAAALRDDGRTLELIPPSDSWARKVLAVSQLDRVIAFRNTADS
jgi:anti-anti-sigma factor